MAETLPNDAEVMDKESLAAIVASELRSVRTYDNTSLAQKRSLAIEYMRGEMNDTPARPNGSQQTSNDFADTVNWMLPGIIRVFTASDQMVHFDKVKAENDDWAQDASEYHNWSFFSDNNGYRILHNATWDSLVLGNGLAMSYYEPPRVADKQTLQNADPMVFAALTEQGYETTGVGGPNPDGTINAILVKYERKGKICDVVLNPENLSISSEAVDIETARFVAYLHDTKTRSDLLELAPDYGWQEEDIQDLPRFSRGTRDETRSARDDDREIDLSSPIASGDLIDLYECYLRVDVDGDGIAETVQAWWAGTAGAGGTLLGASVWEGGIPFTDIPCYPQPHRYDAQSVFDRTHDITRVKTTLLRQGMDNLYASNLPMREIEQGAVLNPDILVNPKFGGIIWKKPGSSPIVPHQVPFVADKAFTALQYFDEVIAKRTGVSRTTMALDPETLQNQSATASQLQHDAGYSQIELVARNMAELGWTKFFRKRLKLSIDAGIVMEIPSKRPDAEESGFHAIDSSKWDENMAVTINVGLGTGSRDRDMQMLMSIMGIQQQMAMMLAQNGFGEKALEFAPKILMAATKAAESSGLKNADEYFPKIDDQEMVAMQQEAAQAKQQPNPEMVKAQMQTQMEQEKLQAQMQLEQVKLQANIESEKAKAQADASKEAAQMQADLATTQQEQNFEAEKFNAEMQFRYAELAMKREIELLKLNAVDQQTTGPDGKPTKAVKSRVDVNNDALVNAVQAMQGAIAAMTSQMNAPVEIVRDPATGKAVGTRKVMVN